MPDSPQSIDTHFFVFHINVFLLGLFALYCVIRTLPRALVHLFQHGEILNTGFFLRSGSRTSPRTSSHDRFDTNGGVSATDTPTSSAVPALVLIPEYGVEGEKGKSSEAQCPALIIPPSTTAAADVRDSPSRRVPTPVLRWIRILRPTLAYVFNFRIAPGISFGNLLVFIIYNALMLYALLHRPNPFTNSQHPGYLAISQLPFAVALAGKTNWLGLACGLGYEKLSYIHRFVGGAIVITADFHGLGVFYKWFINGTARSRLSIPKNSWGLVALCAVDLLFFSSLPFVRKRVYSLFITIHIACVVIILYATYHPRSACVPYVLTAVGIYAFDHLVRVVRTRHTTGWLTAEPALSRGTTLVHVPSLRAGWRAGQHARVRVVSGGWLVWLATWFLCRARPFTIAVGPNSGGVVLQIKALGSWTRNLLRVADESNGVRLARRPEQISALVQRERGPARKVRVIIEGPYGGPGYTLYTAYSGVVLIAGGSGISYVMSILDDTLQKHANGRSRVRVIEVIWSVMDLDSLYALLPELSLLMQPRASPHTSLSLRFNIHWTRVSSRPPRVPRTALPPGMYIRPGRPDIFDTLHSVITGVRCAYSTGRGSGSSDLPSGIVVGSCGPVAFMDDATRAVGRVNWADWKDVGGVENIEEVFGW